MTRIKSASLIVERRWAMTKLVRPSINRFIACWINASVRVSTLDVASSSIIIGGFLMIARAMVRSCFCPCEMFDASSFKMVRSEEHTSELQSHSDLVCRLLLEKKKKKDSKI